MESEPVFGAIYPGDATVLGDPSADVAYRWIREGVFKLIVPHAKNGKVWGDYGDSVQLYNLSKDPGESMNLAADIDQRQRMTRLTKLLDRWWSPDRVSGSWLRGECRRPSES